MTMTNILTANKETEINHLISRVIDINLGHTAFMCNTFQDMCDQGSPQLSILFFLLLFLLAVFYPIYRSMFGRILALLVISISRDRQIIRDNCQKFQTSY